MVFLRGGRTVRASPYRKRGITQNAILQSRCNEWIKCFEEINDTIKKKDKYLDEMQINKRKTQRIIKNIE